MHLRRKYEACKSNIETLRDENAFLELKVRTKFVDIFQIYKLFIVICKTFIVPKYSVYIIVSENDIFITLIIITRQVTRATHVRNRVCPRVELILKIIIILLIIFLGFIKSKPC